MTRLLFSTIIMFGLVLSGGIQLPRMTEGVSFTSVAEAAPPKPRKPPKSKPAKPPKKKLTFKKKPKVDLKLRKGQRVNLRPGSTKGLFKSTWATRSILSLPQNVSFHPKQIQKKFKHATVFGIYGQYNKINARKFQKALKDHISDPGTKRIVGSYRGTKVIHYANKQTGLNVITTRVGGFISGYKLNQIQMDNVINSGRL